MLGFLLLACSLLSIAGADSPPAPQTKDNPPGVVYTAKLLDKDSTTLRGTISGTSGPDGNGVVFNVDFSGFPNEHEFGPFLYHIHQYPVPEDGNCTGAGAHLDPYGRGETPPCNATQPDSCQVGDLSGKHGLISDIAYGNHFVKIYTDPFTSTKPGTLAFFGDLSIVVHYANKTRINCGNFELTSSSPTSASHNCASVSPTNSLSGPSGTISLSLLTPTPTSTPTPTASASSQVSPPPTFNGGAVRVGAGPTTLALAVLIAYFL